MGDNERLQLLIEESLVLVVKSGVFYFKEAGFVQFVEVYYVGIGVYKVFKLLGKLIILVEKFTDWGIRGV